MAGKTIARKSARARYRSIEWQKRVAAMAYLAPGARLIADRRAGLVRAEAELMAGLLPLPASNFPGSGPGSVSLR